MSQVIYSEARKKADKKYTANTDQLRIRIPKGKKGEIYSHADKMNETIGQFVTRAVNEAIAYDTYSKSPAQEQTQKRAVLTSEPQFTYTNGAIYNMDCVDFLRSIETNSVDTVFADPPYNIGKAEWDDLGDQDAYIRWSLKWLAESARALKHTGTLYVCGFTEILADLRKPAMMFFDKCKWLVWYYDNKANLRNDWGRSHESIICFRKSSNYTFNTDDVRIPYNAHTLKYPKRNQSGRTSNFFNEKTANASWEPNPKGAKPKDVINIPTTCNGMSEKTPHPTQKPEELVRRLVLASTNPGELVIDPFSGSGTTAVVASQLGRRFLVSDISQEYNAWADKRIRAVDNTDPERWIDYDKKNELRRQCH